MNISKTIMRMISVVIKVKLENIEIGGNEMQTISAPLS